MIWYELWNSDIQEVEVVKETKKFVFIKNGIGKEDKVAKINSAGGYFKTKKEAFQYGLDRMNKKVKLAELRVNSCKEERKRFLDLYKDIHGLA